MVLARPQHPRYGPALRSCCVFEFIVGSMEDLMKRRSLPQSKVKVCLVGHSRGCTAAIAIANALKKGGRRVAASKSVVAPINVHFMGLYDTVNRSSTEFIDTVMSNVTNCYHATRMHISTDPELGSRGSFGLVSVGQAITKSFDTSHGGIGGDPGFFTESGWQLCGSYCNAWTCMLYQDELNDKYGTRLFGGNRYDKLTGDDYYEAESANTPVLERFKRADAYIRRGAGSQLGFSSENDASALPGRLHEQVEPPARLHHVVAFVWRRPPACGGLSGRPTAEDYVLHVRSPRSAQAAERGSKQMRNFSLSRAEQAPLWASSFRSLPHPNATLDSSMSPSLIGLELAEIREFLGPESPSWRAKQIHTAVYRNRARGWDSITTLPLAQRRELAARLAFGLPSIAAQYESTDGTRRYLLSLADGRTVETVLMPEPGRDTICISTQVGCPVDCKFCLTALMGLERNLTAGEIAAQVLLLASLHNLDPRSSQLNVVMMGQGEPLLNLR